ncbi:MAG: filamentous hemagglutinin N-terminal domain-containing protein [Pseudomonas sp.]
MTQHRIVVPAIPLPCLANKRLLPRPSWLLALAITLPGLSLAEIRLAADANPGQQLGSQLNVPVIGIANPNDRGLSHNRFQQFDVGRPGVVFNNSLAAGTSQLAGQLAANPALTRTANVILTEVTGNQPSMLAGALEVFGAQADVIVANPNGITLNGVKTVNIGGLVASTGVASLGDSLSLDVQNGNARVVVGANGVDTRGLSYFDIVARSVALNGNVGSPGSSADVQVLAGLNRYNAEQRSYTSLPGAPAGAPTLAIEGSVAGAMHGRNITLISSESGVGVRHSGLISAAQDIRIQADGDIELRDVQAGRHLNVQSSGEIKTIANAEKSAIQAAGDIRLAADTIDLGVDMHSQRFTAQAKTLTLNAATLKARANDPVAAALTLDVENLLLNGSLFVTSGAFYLPVVSREGMLQAYTMGRYLPNVTLASTSRIESAGGLRINARRIDNNQGIIDSAGSQGLQISADTLNHLGLMHSEGAIDIAAGTLNNLCLSGQTRDICAGILGATNASFKVDRMNNQAGLAAKGGLALQLGDGRHTNGKSAEIYGGSDLIITRRYPGINSVLDNQGWIRGANEARIYQNAVTNSGSLSIGKQLNLQAYATFINSGQVLAPTLVIATQAMRLNSGSWVGARNTMTLTSSGDFASERGARIYADDLTLTTTGALYNDAQFATRGNMRIYAGGKLTNTGSIFADGDLQMITEQTLTNQNNGDFGGNNLLVKANGDIINSDHGVMVSQSQTTLEAGGTVLNDLYSFISSTRLTIRASLLRNQMTGIIEGWESLHVGANTRQQNTDGAVMMLNGQVVSEAEPEPQSF